MVASVTTTTTVSAQTLADQYLEILKHNETVAAVRDAFKDGDRYEIVGELMDVACEMGYDNDGTSEQADALYDMAEDAADIVAAAIA